MMDYTHTNKSFLDKLIDRLDKIAPESLQSHFLRLVQEKGSLETIFQSIQEGIVVVDREGTISYANRAAEEMIGFTLEKAIGRSLTRYVQGIEWDRILKLDHSEWSRMITSEIEITYPSHRFIAFYVVPMAAEDDDQSGAVVILRDITREREKEDSMIESERLDALKLLAAGVAHEIGNPLNALSIHLQLLDRELGYLKDEEERENLKDILNVASREVSRLDVIITQFLKAIRPQKPQFEETKIDQLVEEALTLMKQEVENRDIRVEVSLPKRPAKVRVDPDQIKQAFYNLIKNALQAMPDGGTLTITVKCSDQFVGISFADNGIGIERDDLGRIFEAYHTTKGDGSGLGLMIVQRIIQDHGGQIEVVSEPGSGTTFTLLLPLNEQRIRLLTAPSAANEGADS